MLKVSVIMNCFNGEKYLHESLTSIISQTYQNWELIFFDNQSTDNSKKILESFKEPRFTYYYAETHTKLYKARNIAMKKTTGDLIAFLDVDDYWANIKLERQCIEFDQDKKLDFVFTKYCIVDELYNKVEDKQKVDISNKKKEELIINYEIGLSTVMIRQDLLKRRNFSFDENFKIIGDFDAFVELILKVKHLYINKRLCFYRWHNSNLSTVNQEEELKELQYWVDKRKNELSLNVINHVVNKINYMLSIKSIKTKKFFQNLKSLFFYKNNKDKIKLFIYLIYYKFFKKFN
jgi:glycosyltransferase involved in cell wall biosynthesis